MFDFPNQNFQKIPVCATPLFLQVDMLKMALTDFILWNTGGIFIANNKERLDEYKRLGTIAKPFGIETYVLSPEETKKLYPLMNVDDIYGTLYSPGDGTIDPNGLCQALTRSATRAGCKVSHTF